MQLTGPTGFLINGVLGAGIFIAGALAVSARPATCDGLTGDSLQQCLQAGKGTRQVRKITFFGPDQEGHDFVYAEVSQSIAVVCTTVKQDGVFAAYRSEADWEARRPWKEVECREGRVDGLWKEYFRDGDLTTVSFFDASGTAVKEAVYVRNQLVREHTFSPSTRAPQPLPKASR